MGTRRFDYSASFTPAVRHGAQELAPSEGTIHDILFGTQMGSGVIIAKAANDFLSNSCQGYDTGLKNAENLSVGALRLLPESFWAIQRFLS